MAMTAFKRIGISLLLGAAAIAPVHATVLRRIVDPPVCEKTARLARTAAQREAHADFSVRVAKCLNDDGCDFPACLEEAHTALTEALDLAQEQYEARVEACALLGGGKYDPELEPGEFSTTVNNTYLPLVPDRSLVYAKQTDAGLERVKFTALDEVVTIDGFRCRVVRDVVTLNGKPHEDTLDFFAQRANGDVWYFGEISRSFEDGFLDNLDGSWRAGKDEAKPGVLMFKAPAIDRTYRQEFLLQDAEDLARIVSLHETVVVPAGTFHDCLQTEEWSALEPGKFERKFYAPGVGFVLGVDQQNGERLELVQIIDDDRKDDEGD